MEWIATDDTQFVKILGENKFEFVEMLNHNDEVHVINHDIIEYTDYTKNEILEYIEPYGYESIEKVKEIYGAEYKEIICECIFESLEEARCFDSLSEKDCVNYMEEVFGIKMQQLDEIDLKDLLLGVSSLTFEEGKAHILSKYPKVVIYENFDEGTYFENERTYDCNFCFDEDNYELMLTYTSSYERTEEDYIVDYENGYWNIHGEQIKS